ncbi:hypothetical protein HD554DRAFT_363879 [Boletus coccyginus]|nr:hypothetical protein HD554DRAFT_363879 [Boletus coccyginus]
MSTLPWLEFRFTGQLETSLPTVLASLSLTSIVFVILTSQVGLYFWKSSIHRRDALWIKGTVVFIWMMQALEVALACHMAALVHIHDSVPKERFKECLWEWAIYIATSTITECLVHAYFISRICILETNRVHVGISMILCIILVLEGSFGFISMLLFAISGLKEPDFVVFSWAVPVWLGLSILMDILIAGSICYTLRKGGPFVSMRLSLLVQRLTKFCIQTGLITGLVTGITVALWIAAQLDPGHLLMSFPMGGSEYYFPLLASPYSSKSYIFLQIVYATCFMTNLIARESYFHHIQLDGDDECFGTEMGGIVFVTPENIGKNGSISTGM